MPPAKGASCDIGDSTTEAIEDLQTASDELESLVSGRLRGIKDVFVKRLEQMSAELVGKDVQLLAAYEHAQLLKTELDNSYAMLNEIGPKYFTVVDPDGDDDFDGILFNSSMTLSDVNENCPSAKFGETILATPIDENWVMVKPGQFFPTNIDGCPCLQMQPDKIPTFAQTVTSLKDQVVMFNTNNHKHVATQQGLQEENARLQEAHSRLQTFTDGLQQENSRLRLSLSGLQQNKARLQKWPWFTWHPWRLKDTVPTSKWHSVEGAPAEVMCAECLQDSSMWQHIVDIFRTCGNPYQVLSINALHNTDGLKIFESTLRRLEQHRQEGGIFDTEIGEDDPNRKLVIDRLKAHFLRQPPSVKFANTLFVWYGGSSDAIAGITRNGFADLKRIDDAWFGSALYTTTDARYACMYSTGEIHGTAPVGNGPWKVVLAAMAMSQTFPVTRADYPEGQPDCRYKGKPLKDGYHTHAVVVDPEDGYQAAQDPSASGFKPLEVLAAEEGHLLPLAVVEFQ